MVCSPGRPTEILRQRVPNDPGQALRHASRACASTHGNALPGWYVATVDPRSFLPTAPRSSLTRRQHSDILRFQNHTSAQQLWGHSSVGERINRTDEVGGSNPPASTGRQ